MTGDPDDDKTVFQPQTPAASSPEDAAPAAPEPPLPPPTASEPPATGVGPGVLLNETYRIDAFVAEGGMGKVFRGVNVHDGEPVAIKTILPHLAADENAMGLFRREAGILGKVNHDAVVGYRGLMRDSAQDVTYLVMQYVDGAPLEGTMTGGLSEPELTTLLRTLADGLRAAHARGAVHRDIAPDNVLLRGGRVQDPVIIDFGIAKDNDAGEKTILGDGFAGKLAYVAPEQFGLYGRDVGPHTDVYSLALVIWAAARGEPAPMGGSLADAMAARQGVPDLSEVPATLRPVLTAMLQPDPKDRLADMGAVLGQLDGTIPPAPAVTAFPGPAAEASDAAAPGAGRFAASQTGTTTKTSPLERIPNWALIAVPAVALLGVLALVAPRFFGGEPAPIPDPAATDLAVVDPVEAPEPGRPEPVDVAPVETEPVEAPVTAPTPVNDALDRLLAAADGARCSVLEVDRVTLSVAGVSGVADQTRRTIELAGGRPDVIAASTGLCDMLAALKGAIAAAGAQASDPRVTIRAVGPLSSGDEWYFRAMDDPTGKMVFEVAGLAAGFESIGVLGVYEFEPDGATYPLVDATNPGLAGFFDGVTDPDTGAFTPPVPDWERVTGGDAVQMGLPMGASGVSGVIVVGSRSGAVDMEAVSARLNAGDTDGLAALLTANGWTIDSSFTEWVAPAAP